MIDTLFLMLTGIRVVVSQQSFSKFKKISIFVSSMYPEKNISSILAFSLQLNNPTPNAVEAMADITTKIKTFNGFVGKKNHAPIIRPTIVDKPITISTKAIILINFLTIVY
ncbi:MAG: hypothetical protein WC330_00935 [Candidatus Omnitrophota bacterium]|jgi:hypothetical protein